MPCWFDSGGGGREGRTARGATRPVSPQQEQGGITTVAPSGLYLVAVHLVVSVTVKRMHVRVQCLCCLAPSLSVAFLSSVNEVLRRVCVGGVAQGR